MHAGPVPGKEHQVLAVAQDKAAVVPGRRERGGHAASTAAADRALSGLAADPGLVVGAVWLRRWLGVGPPGQDRDHARLPPMTTAGRRGRIWDGWHHDPPSDPWSPASERLCQVSEDEVESGVRSTSADTSSDQPLSEWPAGPEADRTLAQRTAAVGLTDRKSLSEFALMADHPLRLSDYDGSGPRRSEAKPHWYSSRRS
jgi:hypothetical protein